MARKIIDIGTVGNDGTGDSIRDSFRKVNDNFRELYSSLGLGEGLTFVGLSDVSPNTYIGQNDPDTGSTPLVTVNNTESGLTFKRLVPGVGIGIDFTANGGSEIVINSEFSEISADTSPQLGGNLSAKSGTNQYRIRDLVIPITDDEAANKDYVDTKLSRAGVDAIDPATGFVTTSLGRMSGPLLLSRDPEPEDDELYDGLVAATKRYVDNSAFGSVANLYVATSGQDERTGVSKEFQGRALAYAYRSIEAALKRAEELLLESRVELGPYKKRLTYGNGVFPCTLDKIDTSPTSGSSFAGTVEMSVDTATLNSIGTNYFPGDILTISGGTIASGGEACRIEVLTTLTTPGAISTFRIVSSGVYASPTLPGPVGVATTISTSAAPALIGAIGTGATFDVTYKVNSVNITNQGSGYSLVSVRIEGGGGAGAFGTAEVIGGKVVGITITDQGSDFTSIPILSVDLPRFFVFTNNQRTDFTGDVLSGTPESFRGRDIREGLYLRGETSGALAQILAHSGELSTGAGSYPVGTAGSEIFDVDIQYGAFIEGEELSYGDVTTLTQISVLIETGIYEENYPLKVPRNVAIIGDEFRRVIIKPRTGTSSSPWAFKKFRRDLNIDGLTIAENLYAYHYLENTESPVYPPIKNKGNYNAAAALIELNRSFMQEEVIAWMDYQILNNIAPFTTTFPYDKSLCKRDVGLLVNSFIFDLKYGGYDRTISAALKYYQSPSALVAITAQLSAYEAVLGYLESLMLKIIDNTDIVPVYQDLYSQIVDRAFTAETEPITCTISYSTPADIVTLDSVTLTPIAHGLLEDDPVEFSSTGSLPDGIVDGLRYYVISSGLTSTSFRVSTAEGGTAAFTTSAGSGTHTVTTGASSVITSLLKAFFDVIDGSGSVNYPKDNDKMDVFLANDANIVRAVTCQGHGGFMMVLDPTGQILAKSPYAQECASFSKSIDAQTFAGGMFVDGFSGNLQFTHTASASTTRISIASLERLPNLPASFIVDDTVHRINYVRDFTYNKAGSTATLVLDETTPFVRTPGSQISTISIGSPAIITKADHRLQDGAIVKFSTTGTLPTGLLPNKEYFVLGAGLTNNTFRVSGTFGSSIPVTTTGAGSGTHSYQRIYEILMPGNRSMLANDFTQVNDMGYGAIAQNGGLIELVSMFTYYCYISYYSNRGGQIRSVAGSSAHGVYALVAEGSDPLEIPTPTESFDDLGQRVICYAPSPSYFNASGGLFVYVQKYNYQPLASSELEVDHGNVIYRYPITSVSTTDLPPGVTRLNLTSDPTGNFTGLFDQILDGERMTLRSNAKIVLTGSLVNVAVRPSTGLRLNESSTDVYRVLQFEALEESTTGALPTGYGPYEISVDTGTNILQVLATIVTVGYESDDITVATDLCRTSVNHKLQLGDTFVPTSSANGLTSGTTYYVVDIPNYDEFYLSTSINGSVESLSSGTGLSIKGVKPHGLLENFTIGFESSVTLPSPLVEGTIYYVIPDNLTTTQFQISTIKNSSALDITTSGTGIHTYAMLGLTKTTIRENYDFLDLTLYQPGEAVYLSSSIATVSIASPGVVTTIAAHELAADDSVIFSTTGVLPTGITSGVRYYVISAGLTSTSFRLSSTPGGSVINTSVTQSGTHSFTRGGRSSTVTVASPAVVSTVSSHGLLANDKIQFTAVGGTLPIGISESLNYYVLSSGLTGTSFQVSTSIGGAAANTTVVGTGTPHFTKIGNTCTISVGSPATITKTSHGLSIGDVIKFETTGSLPVGISSQGQYFVRSTNYTVNSFEISVEPEALVSSVAVDTSGSQSGQHYFSRVTGRTGDSSIPVVALGSGDVPRADGTKFLWKGEEYTIVDYQPETVTNKPYGRLLLNRPLVDSIIDYGSSYTIRSAVSKRSTGAAGSLTIRISLTRVTGHDLLEIGTGSYADTNYPNEIYGPSVNALNDDNEVDERDVGRVFYVTTDQFGNFNVGPYFRVDQGTGRVTFASAIALSNLDGIGFKRGVPISEFSTDSGFSDNATDTVPTENATRIYVERRLGISHDGAPVAAGLLIPSVTGGYMALDGQLAMKANMDLDGNKIVNVGNPVSPLDAVNLQSLTFDNFQNFSGGDLFANDILVFTGDGAEAINATVVGDIALDIDSTANTVDAQINPDVILDADVNTNADILQSKLLLNLSTTRAAAPTGTARNKQAASGVASFDNIEFTITDGWVTLKTATTTANGVAPSKLQWLPGTSVLGNPDIGLNGNVESVQFSQVVNLGEGVRKDQYGQYGASTGVLRRTTSGALDTAFTTIDVAVGTAAAPEGNKLILRNASGNFGANIGDLSQLYIDGKLAIDSAVTSGVGTNGYFRLYGYTGNGGILIQDGDDPSNRKTSYWNNLHAFKTRDGSTDGDITARSVQCQSLTTGGNITNGEITGRWTLTGTSPNESRLQATYSADLAENYEGDKLYEVGTVLVFGGDKEVTTTTAKSDTRVAGVVSNTAAYTMYEACPGHKNLVALQGRVPCRVVGKITKGDILITAGIPGVAMAATGDVKVGTVVGKSLVDYDSDHIGTIEIAVGRT
jgi:hypothetical protein